VSHFRTSAFIIVVFSITFIDYAHLPSIVRKTIAEKRQQGVKIDRFR
jgi:hypothetical protein